MYKSMEILSWHSKETTWATTIKNTFYVETNVRASEEKILE